MYNIQCKKNERLVKILKQLDYTKVLVGVSGGVDSSVAVDLLKKQGLTVEGVVIKFSNETSGAIIDAKKVSEFLGIKLHIADATKDFDELVVTSFCKNYCDGITPNPCVICNPLVKFKTLIDLADELGIGYIATGHYAQVVKIEDTFYIKKAVSFLKDQSYMLYRLSQEVLSRLILPLGGYEKTQIRQQAKDINLFNADKPDSQEICFIPSNNHAQFIEDKGYKAKEGYFISPANEKLNKHLGVHHYTVGQRKGLNIALGKPVFVKEISENGDVLLAYSGDEYFNSVTISDVVYTNLKKINIGDEFSMKVRSAAKGDKAKIMSLSSDSLTVVFNEPIRATAKGQSVVIYEDDLVLAGGFITKSENI